MVAVLLLPNNSRDTSCQKNNVVSSSPKLSDAMISAAELDILCCLVSQCNMEADGMGRFGVLDFYAISQATDNCKVKLHAIFIPPVEPNICDANAVLQLIAFNMMFSVTTGCLH